MDKKTRRLRPAGEQRYYTLSEACMLFGIVPQDYRQITEAAKVKPFHAGVQTETIRGKEAQTA